MPTDYNYGGIAQAMERAATARWGVDREQRALNQRATKAQIVSAEDANMKTLLNSNLGAMLANKSEYATANNSKLDFDSIQELFEDRGRVAEAPEWYRQHIVNNQGLYDKNDITRANMLATAPGSSTRAPNEWDMFQKYAAHLFDDKDMRVKFGALDKPDMEYFDTPDGPVGINIKDPDAFATAVGTMVESDTLKNPDGSPKVVPGRANFEVGGAEATNAQRVAEYKFNQTGVSPKAQMLQDSLVQALRTQDDLGRSPEMQRTITGLQTALDQEMETLGFVKTGDGGYAKDPSAANPDAASVSPAVASRKENRTGRSPYRAKAPTDQNYTVVN